MSETNDSRIIRVRFAKHIPSSARQGLLAELYEMGVTQIGAEGDYVLLRLGRPAKHEYVIRLLTEEEKTGRLVWETKQIETTESGKGR
jgi:hypothetical protein